MLQWTDKLKYLGVFFCINTCHVDVQTAVRKFYGSFNNVLSVLWKARNEMTAVYLMERYCLPILNYASEIWDMSTSESRKINIVWNNSFRKIFNCCWRESASSLQFYCDCLPLNYLTDQPTLLFYRRLYRSDNYILRVLLGLRKYRVAALCMILNIVYGKHL